MPFGLGVPSPSLGVGAALLDPGLGPGTPLRFSSLAIVVSSSPLAAGVLDVASALSPLSTVLVLGFDVSDCEGFVLAGKGSESSYGNCVRRYEDSFSLMILLCRPYIRGYATFMVLR